MLQKDDIPQEVWGQAQAVASSMSPEERAEIVSKQMMLDCMKLYAGHQGKLSLRQQKIIRQEFISSYPTKNLQKAAALTHDKFKEIYAKEIYRTNNHLIRTFLTAGMMVIVALLIFLIVGRFI